MHFGEKLRCGSRLTLRHLSLPRLIWQMSQKLKNFKPRRGQSLLPYPLLPSRLTTSTMKRLSIIHAIRISSILVIDLTSRQSGWELILLGHWLFILSFPVLFAILARYSQPVASPCRVIGQWLGNCLTTSQTISHNWFYSTPPLPNKLSKKRHSILSSITEKSSLSRCKAFETRFILGRQPSCGCIYPPGQLERQKPIHFSET